ncbi:MAG: sulfate reduction electron transfer complex DsrMKJOP subunit DsrJ [Thermodesulfobacteriota bacterium]
MADYKNEFGWFAERPQVEKKVYNKFPVLIGLAAFVILATAPLWLNAGRDVPPPDPNLDTPVIQQLAKKQCVLPTEEMRAYHMQLLIDWRDQVVRTGEKALVSGPRVWTSPDGRKFVPSLSNTCLGCHSNKAEFCDQCHDYAAVTPNCWGCHLEEPATKAGQVAQAEVK